MAYNSLTENEYVLGKMMDNGINNQLQERFNKFLHDNESVSESESEPVSESKFQFQMDTIYSSEYYRRIAVALLYIYGIYAIKMIHKDTDGYKNDLYVFLILGLSTVLVDRYVKNVSIFIFIYLLSKLVTSTDKKYNKLLIRLILVIIGIIIVSFI